MKRQKPSIQAIPAKQALATIRTCLAAARDEIHNPGAARSAGVDITGAIDNCIRGIDDWDLWVKP